MSGQFAVLPPPSAEPPPQAPAYPSADTPAAPPVSIVNSTAPSRGAGQEVSAKGRGQTAPPQAVEDALLPAQSRRSAHLGSGGQLDLGWGRVVLGEMVGDGGMGTVYRGWIYYNPNGPYAGRGTHPVAVKVLHPNLHRRERVRQLFEGEATALAKLSHPNIVTFLGMGEAHGQLAIVIEFVRGEPLDALIERHAAQAGKRGQGANPGLPCLPFMRAWHYFQQLLGALAATHALGIVHRDVKPANVLLRADGMAKLSDYGIARLPSAEGEGCGGMQPGTGIYMSPEQVLGRPIDGRSDLYSAAIVLYECLAGRTPFEFEGRSELQVRASQLDEAPPPLSRFVPQAPPVLDELFAKALEKDPTDRFSSAIVFGDAFRAALRLPESAGWKAQKALAKGATRITGFNAASSKGGTIPIPKVDAERMRLAVAGAYRQSG